MDNLLEGKSINKVPTGIEGLDLITKGGLPRGRPVLVAGSAGSGKTVLAGELLCNSIQKFNCTGIWVSLEEREKDLIANFESQGRDVSTLIQENKLVILDLSTEVGSFQDSGNYNLDGFLLQLREAIREIDAEFLVIDSISAFLQHLPNPSIVRRELLRLINVLRQEQLVSIINAERDEGYNDAICRFNVEEFVPDTLVILRQTLMKERSRRTLQIWKMRGCDHFRGEFPFSIGPDGITLLPVSSRELTQETSQERGSMGIPDLDKMMGGGFFRRSSIMVSGPSGCGKSLLGLTFLNEGCLKGEKGLLMGFEESAGQIKRNAKNCGMDIADWEKKGMARLLIRYPETMSSEDHLAEIQKVIEEFKPKRVVFDAISALARTTDEQYLSEFLLGLCAFIKHQDSSLLLTANVKGSSGLYMVIDQQISTMTDAILVLRYVDIEGELRRGILVAKMRGSDHDKMFREFRITNAGQVIGQPFKDVDSFFLGSERK